VASDLNQKLLVCMRDMIHDNQKKVQAIKAWGWFIYLLSLDASENTCLINRMLKIPERTFTDSDPQVQIATLVSYFSFCGAVWSK
jgi:telomere-associated protein RIF1